MQKEKLEEMFQSVINEELSITTAREQLRTLYVPGDAIKLILDTAIAMCANKTNTLHMHDLSVFHYLIDRRNTNELSFPDFAIHRRQNLTYRKFSSSPMHMLDLGKISFYYLQLH